MRLAPPKVERARAVREREAWVALARFRAMLARTWLVLPPLPLRSMRLRHGFASAWRGLVASWA